MNLWGVSVMAKIKFKKVIALGLLTSTEEKVRLVDAEIQYRNKSVIKHNNLIKKLCQKNEIEFIDILPYFNGREEELLFDHIHPNEDGKKIILYALEKHLY
jgi:lysophospholipase L1-like esterase